MLMKNFRFIIFVLCSVLTSDVLASSDAPNADKMAKIAGEVSSDQEL